MDVKDLVKRMKKYDAEEGEQKKLEAEISYMLEERVQPSVAMHGGKVELKEMDHDNGIVTVYMSGSCAGCSMSQMTLKGGVENMLIHYFPEKIKMVEAEFSEVENPYYV